MSETYVRTNTRRGALAIGHNTKVFLTQRANAESPFYLVVECGEGLIKCHPTAEQLRELRYEITHALEAYSRNGESR